MVFLTRTERVTLGVLALAAVIGLAVNLYRLHGERVTVEIAPRAEETLRAEGALAASRRLSLNTATPAELERLPGVGPTLAARIVAYRASHGPFASVETLREVDGIGPALATRLSEYTTL